MSDSNLALLQAHIGANLAEKGLAPVTRWLGGELTKAEKGVARVDFVVREEMTNLARILHGGIMSTMIDEVMGIAFFTLDLEYFFPTVNLNVDFMAPAQIGDLIQVEASITKQGKTIIYTEAIVKNGDGKLLAKGSSHVAKSHIRIK